MVSVAFRAVAVLYVLLVSATAVATILGFAGSLWWIADLTSHFRVAYAAVLFTGVFVAAYWKRWWITLGCVFLCGVNVWLVAPLVLDEPVARAEGPDLTIVTWNAGGGTTTDPSALVRYVSESQPDVLVLNELTPQLHEALLRSLASYRSASLPLQGSRGIGAYVRGELIEGRTPEIAGVPAVELTLQKSGVTFHVLGIRSWPPRNSILAHKRDRLLAEVTRWVTSMHGRHLVVTGDFNATPWSYPFRSLVDRGNLENAQDGHGLGGTWPAPLGPLALPVDHTVHSQSLVTIRHTVGPHLGSDHYPIEVVLRARSAERKLIADSE
jgi:endonuclease/exonuclease/phosphatase (EEP) superfamily protein YafD